MKEISTALWSCGTLAGLFSYAKVFLVFSGLLNFQYINSRKPVSHEWKKLCVLPQEYSCLLPPFLLCILTHAHTDTSVSFTRAKRLQYLFTQSQVWVHLNK